MYVVCLISNVPLQPKWWTISPDTDYTAMGTHHRMSVTAYRRLKSYTMTELRIYSTEDQKVFYLFLTHYEKLIKKEIYEKLIKKEILFWIGCIKVHEHL